MVVIAVLASFVTFLDGTVVTVALPAIRRELGGGIATQQWVVDAYLITLSALILLAGSLSDAFGRVRIMRIGLVAFGIASIAVAAAPHALVLILARAAQGAAGALLVPSSLALITATMRGEVQARAIGVWTAFTTGAQVAGPLLGGLFVDFLSWRFVFLINVLPIAVTLVLLGRLRLPDHQRGVRLDWLSGALCAFGLGGLVFALIEQPRLGWGSPAIWPVAAAGVVLLAAFLLRQRTEASMMPLSLFRVGNFGWGNLATLFVYAGLSLNGFVIGVYLQQGAGLSATAAGLASLPITILMIVLSSRAGAWAGVIGPRFFMTVGPLLMAGGRAAAAHRPRGFRLLGAGAARHDPDGSGALPDGGPAHRSDPGRDRRAAGGDRLGREQRDLPGRRPAGHRDAVDHRRRVARPLRLPQRRARHGRADDRGGTRLVDRDQAPCPGTRRFRGRGRAVITGAAPGSYPRLRRSLARSAKRRPSSTRIPATVRITAPPSEPVFARLS